jgi:hypothetical protein
VRRSLLLAWVMIGACRFDSAGLPGAADRQPGDWPATDAPLRDGPAEHAIVDQNPTADGRPDRAALDARPDKALPPDQPIKPDQYVPPDQYIKPDQPPPGPPCTAGTPPFTFQANMVICKGAVALTQCQAASACNTGWHLCTASEYVARGGRTKQPPTGGWIAGVIRSGGKAHAPTDGVLAACGISSLATWADIAWTCSPQFLWQANDPDIAVVTNAACRRLGADDPANAAYWIFEMGFQTTSWAVCCL